MKGRKLLMIPGPIEFDPAVLQAVGTATTSHVAPAFIECFGQCLEMMRQVWQCPSGQPFILAGSGTLAMDMAGANLTEPGDKALVVSTGYFGERYGELLRRYGAEVRLLQAGPGQTVPPEDIEEALQEGGYKLLAFTHVDTSTAVRVDPRPIGELGRKYGVLTILDGVCSVAGEDIRQEEWGIDVVLTASQKAVGVPPGLALLMASERAMEAFRARKSPVGSYYADWTHWLPVMQAYEARKPAYFGTPAVNLVAGLQVSLRQILAEGLENRFERHRRLAASFRAGMRALGLQLLPQKEDTAANTLSAVYYPEGVAWDGFIGRMGQSDVIVATGLLPELRTRYFRVGHMGAVSQADLLATTGAIGQALQGCGHDVPASAGLTAMLKAIDAV